VHASYGKYADSTYLGIKNGTYDVDMYVAQLIDSHHLENNYSKTYDITYKKYNMTTDELIDAWTE
jgi:hypothetical protein